MPSPVCGYSDHLSHLKVGRALRPVQIAFGPDAPRPVHLSLKRPLFTQFPIGEEKKKSIAPSREACEKERLNACWDEGRGRKRENRKQKEERVVKCCGYTSYFVHNSLEDSFVRQI